VTLGWSAVSGASGYEVEVATGSCGASPFQSFSTANTSYPVAGLTDGQTYYWRARSVYGSSGTSPFSSCFSFSVSSGYLISGYVKNSSGQGLTAITVTLTGGPGGSTTTSSSGYYFFDHLPNGNYTVTPSKADFTFSPPSRSVTISGASQSYIDFVGTYSPVGYLISGYVKNSSGQGLTAITVTLTGGPGGSTTTSSSGYYFFDHLPNGNYTVTPSKTGWTFNPSYRAVTLSGSSQSQVNFVGTLR
jgi:hypothetical protein